MCRKRTLLFLFWIASVMPMPLVNAGQWQDDFSDKRMKNWNRIVGNWRVIDGTMAEVQNSGNPLVPAGDDNNAYRIIAQTDWDFTDGTIEVQIKFDEKARFFNDAMVLYRWVDADNGYAARLQLDDFVTVGKVLNGQYEHIKEVGNLTVDPGVWYKVKVEVTGVKVSVFVNGVEKLQTTDPDFKRGKVGLGASRVNDPPIFFDNFKVTGFGVGGAQPVNPPGKLPTIWAQIKEQF